MTTTRVRHDQMAVKWNTEISSVLIKHSNILRFLYLPIWTYEVFVNSFNKHIRIKTSISRHDWKLCAISKFKWIIEQQLQDQLYFFEAKCHLSVSNYSLPNLRVKDRQHTNYLKHVKTRVSANKCFRIYNLWIYFVLFKVLNYERILTSTQ